MEAMGKDGEYWENGGWDSQSGSVLWSALLLSKHDLQHSLLVVEIADQDDIAGRVDIHQIRSDHVEAELSGEHEWVSC